MSSGTTPPRSSFCLAVLTPSISQFHALPVVLASPPTHRLALFVVLLIVGTVAYLDARSVELGRTSASGFCCGRLGPKPLPTTFGGGSNTGTARCTWCAPHPWSTHHFLSFKSVVAGSTSVVAGIVASFHARECAARFRCAASRSALQHDLRLFNRRQ